ncbi:hypothetical protein, partial [Agrobacterium sp.]|uniref:hypothetical protein n=1 Tax=Agrobacterium sp. TaxID=361 RepID=UPI004033D7FD
MFGNLSLSSPTTTTRNPVSSLGPSTQDSSSLRQLSTHASRGQRTRAGAGAAAKAAANAVRDEVAPASSQLSTPGSGQEEQAGGAASRGLAGMFDVQVQPAAFFQVCAAQGQGRAGQGRAGQGRAG